MSYKHISSNGTYLCQRGTTTLGKVVIGTTGSAWTLTIYNGVDNTGDVVGVISAQDGGNYEYETVLSDGLCVVAAGTTAGDATINWS